jgi:ribose 5-phosphate isomerase B
MAVAKKVNIMEEKKTIYIGSDHAGFNLKNYFKAYLSKLGYDAADMGNEKYDPVDDYPDYALKVAEKVAETNGRGIIFCDSGVGACIVANKVKGIRAVNAYDAAIAGKSRLHNNTNILCLGQNYISVSLARKIVHTWLETEFSQKERHHRRVGKIDKL